MIQILRIWYQRYFSDPQAVILAFMLIVGFAVVLTFGKMLAPVLASVVIAYLLEGLVRFLVRYRLPRLAAVLLVFAGFMAFQIYVLFGLVPLLWYQVTQFFQELPNMIAQGQAVLSRLPER